MHRGISKRPERYLSFLWTEGLCQGCIFVVQEKHSRGLLSMGPILFAGESFRCANWATLSHWIDITLAGS